MTTLGISGFLITNVETDLVDWVYCAPTGAVWSRVLGTIDPSTHVFITSWFFVFYIIPEFDSQFFNGIL
jgi:hypothetical protein